ncbi:MAG: AAA family ATPase [Flavobacterium sp.]
MLPIKLTISGLYSYQKKQIVDFQQLSESGLFGIFGKVGSGKSSILEAISFALYGQTERLNARDSRAYNMMNLKSNEVLIEFDFENYEQKKFRFRARWKRNKNQFSETSTAERQAFEWIDNQWIPLESNDATSVVGLSYENFKRTLIIPQGQFKEFLDLKDTDRSKMMKEIFHLEAFDVSDKVAKLLKKTNDDLNFLNGKLTAYQDINPLKIKSIEDLLSNLKTALTNALERQENLAKKVAETEKVEALFIELNQKKHAFALLEKEQAEIENLKVKLTEFELVRDVFQQKIERQNELQLTIQKQQKGFEQTEVEFEKNEKVRKQLQNDFESIHIVHQKIEDESKKWEDLKKIIGISEALQNKKTLENRCAKGEQVVAEEENQLRKLLTEEAELKAKNDAENQKIIEPQILFEVKQWFENRKKCWSDIEKQSLLIQKNSEERVENEKNLLQLGYDLMDWKEKIAQQTQQNLAKKEVFQTQLNSILVQKELVSHAQNLKEGEACPVCGATTHPNVMNDEDLSVALQNIQSEIEACVTQSEHITKTEKRLHELQFHISQSALQIKQNQEELALAQAKLKELEDSFHWQNFEKEDENAFETIENEQRTMQQNIKNRNVLIDENRKLQSESQRKMNQSKDLLTALKLERESRIATTSTLKNGLLILKWEDFETVEISHIQQQMNDLALKIKEVKNKFITLQNQLLEQDKKNIQLESEIKHLKHHLDDLKLNINTLKEDISNLLLQHPTTTIEKITEILSLPFDVSKTRKQIQDFENEWQQLKSQLLHLEIQTSGVIFDAATFEAQKTALTESKNEVTELLAKQMSVVKEMEDLQKKLTEKQQFEKEQQALENRSLNLKTLSNLFKGQGFVEYVSGVYLRNLCAIANQRFHRMTKNSLSLSLNDKNNFEIIDYLNQGFTRSIKTLSGGQSFQAALCLALALAENVQSLSKNSKNFFFIDEGFGTQDPESIEIIYETLQQLHKENRVVGIISHSEALQEKITNSILIVNDVETGSRVFHA